MPGTSVQTSTDTNSLIVPALFSAKKLVSCACEICFDDYYVPAHNMQKETDPRNARIDSKEENNNQFYVFSLEFADESSRAYHRYIYIFINYWYIAIFLYKLQI